MQATRRLADGYAVRLEAFGPVRVTAAAEDDAERVALELGAAVLAPDLFVLVQFDEKLIT